MNNSIERAGGPWSHCALGKHPSAGVVGDHDSWWDVQDLNMDQLEAGLGTDELSAAQISALQGFAAGEDVGASVASAWLSTLQGEALVADVVLPGTGTRMFMGGKGAVTENRPELLGVYPNPTKGEAYVTYKLPEGSANGELQVSDATGRSVDSRNLTGASGIIELPKSQLPPGMYTVALHADGILLSTVKFISVR